MPQPAHYTFPGLSAATQYTIRIASIDNDGNESAGVATSGVTLLANPVGLTVQPFSGMVELSWNASQPSNLVNHYAVYVSTSNFNDVSSLTPGRVVSAGTTTTRLAGLVNDTTYYYAVTAINLSGGEQTQVSTVAETPVADSQGPTILSVTYDGVPLTAGSTLTRNGVVAATASDPAGVSQIEFYYDGTLVRRDTGAPYNANLDVMNSTDGRAYRFAHSL